jgi:aldehyde dehydrogenase (NAD+)
MDEAVARANATRYGLGSTVFAKERAMEIASRLRAGMTAVNGVISFAAIPSLPFGGVGDSGFGRIHGADGLKEFTYPQAIARQRFKPLLTLTSFARTEKTEQQLAQLVTMLHGRGTTIATPGPVRQRPSLRRATQRRPKG